MLKEGGEPNLRDVDGGTPARRYTQTVRMYGSASAPK